MAIDYIRFAIRKAGSERELLLLLCQAYNGRPTITLAEFLRDFVSGQGGKPMQRKTALNRIYNGTFPVPVLHDRIWLADVAAWLYQERTKRA
jgi:hypothetical protein